MYAADHERPDQQPRHTPERPEKQWIFFWIMVRSVREVPGKAARGPFVALLAGLYDILSAQVRTGIGYRENIVRPMAVVTLRRFSVAELRDFAVIRVEVGLCNLLVTAAALRHDRQFEA